MRDDVKDVGSSNHWKYLPGGARLAGKQPTSTWNAQKDPGRLGEEQNKPTRSDESNTVVGELHSQTQCIGNACSNVGYTGLTNLGNTCFMNCVLQALVNIRELRDYFLSMTFIDDVNKKNPLGTQGRLAKMFYTTLKHLWSGQVKPFAPVSLRNIVASRAPQFLGIMQQDAQEFMAFFLDALHEDLNRIREKPVFEIGNNDNIPDDILAKKFWDLHRSRNDSFVVDKFHGMYKSRLTCPVCEKESITFDPFLFLSVPLPKPMQLVSVVFLSEKYDYEILHVDVSVSEEGTTAELLMKIAQKYDAGIENLRLFEIESGLVKKEYSRSSPIPTTRISSLVIYDAGNSSNLNQMKTVFLLQTTEVPKSIDICAKCGKCPEDTGSKVRRCTKCKRAGYCNQDCQKADWALHKTHCTPHPFISCPLLMNISQTKVSYQNLSMTLLKHAKHTTSIYGKNHGVMNAKFSCLENSTIKKDDAQNLFNILICYDDNVDNLTRIPEETESEINLSSTVNIVIEWKINVNAVGKSIKCGARSKKNCDPTLQDCIQLFTEPEVLATEEAWYCPNCKQHREATKQLSLWHLPDILVIQLKRFSFRNRLWRDKIDKLINFPIKGLDMRPFCIDGNANHPIYDLFAVVNHHGGLFGGHYTSFVKLTDESGTNPDLGWRLCDDSHVTSVRCEEDVVTSSAYVVFFQKRKQVLFDGNTENEFWHSAKDLHNIEKCDFGKKHFNDEDGASATGDSQLCEEMKKNATFESTASFSVTSHGINRLADKITTKQNKSDERPVEIGSGEGISNKDKHEIASNVGLLYTDMDAVD